LTEPHPEELWRSTKLLADVGEDGKASVAKAGRVYSRLSLNDLGEDCHATPAIGGKMLLIRTLHTLWAFGN
jgi:hypothetical protein